MEYNGESFNLNEHIKAMKSSGSRIINITHNADFDGIGSASLMRHYFKVPLENILLSDYEPSMINKVIEEVKRRIDENYTVILTDLGIDDKTIPLYNKLLDFIKSKNSTVIWLDHHNWPQECIDNIAYRTDFAIVGDNGKFCGAELTYKYLISENFDNLDFGKKIANLTHQSDFNLPNQDPVLYKIKDYITYCNNESDEDSLKKLVYTISKDDFTNKYIDELANKYKSKEKTNIDYLLDHMYTFKLKDHVVGIGFASYLESNSACYTISESCKSDMSIFVNIGKGRINLRSKGDFDCIPIAMAFGGNGHKNASGASLDEGSIKVIGSIEKQKEFVDKVNRLMKNLYLNKSTT